MVTVETVVNISTEVTKEIECSSSGGDNSSNITISSNSSTLHNPAETSSNL